MTEEDILRAMEEVVQGPCQDLREGVDDPQKSREGSVSIRGGGGGEESQHREYSQPKSFAVCSVFSV